MKSKKQFYVVIFIVVVVTAILTWAINNFIVYGVTDETTGKFRTATSIIKRNSYQDVSDLELQDGSILGLVSSLDDPYSSYLSKEQVEEFENQFTAEYTGLGVKSTKIIDGFMVHNVADNSPANAAGIQANDIIVELNGNEVSAGESTLSQMLTKNYPLSSVKVLRNNDPLEIKVEVATSDFSTNIGHVVEKDGKNILVLDLQKFTDKTPELLAKQIEILTEQQAQRDVKDETGKVEETTEDSAKNTEMPMIDGVIFDLRNNPGGSVDTAKGILEQLVESNYAMYKLEGKKPLEETTDNKEANKKGGKPEDTDKNIEEAKSKLKEFPIKLPITILVNDRTASSAEMVGVALRDTVGPENSVVKPQIVGSPSAGKSSIQRIFTMNDGSGLKLTTHKWYSPGGVDVEKDPLSPKTDEDKVTDAYPFTVSTIGATESYENGDRDENGSETIAKVQMTLNFFEYNTKRTDGLFDTETETVLKQFQADHGIEQTGKIDRPTLFELNKQLTAYVDNPENDAVLNRGVAKTVDYANGKITEKDYE